MSELIIRNDLNDSEDDVIVLQYLNDFKAEKCLYCFQADKKFLCQCKDCGFFFCNNIFSAITCWLSENRLKAHVLIKTLNKNLKLP